MNAMIADTAHLAMRRLRALARSPFYILATIVQPVIWLIFFGQLFQRVVDLPGFQTGSYISYLAPGVVVMTALFSSGWSGMNLVIDMERGVLNRFLVTPAPRAALTTGNVIFQAVNTLLQSAIIFGLALLLGARFQGGVPGLLAFAAAIVLLTAAFASFSDAIALRLRQQESIIGVNTTLVLPLSFLSAAFLPLSLVPTWMRWAARLNPVNWAVEVGRQSLAGGTDWSLILTRMGLLLALAVVCAWFATSSFRAYRRSM